VNPSRPLCLHLVRHLAAWLLVWLCCATGWAATATPPRLSEYFRETWTTREGLPHNLVADIAQTPDGYLWFATWEGAVRYSGREFTLYDRLKIGVLPDSGLRSLYPLSGGLLFAGARGGLAVYSAGRWDALPPADGLINDVLIDRRGTLWAGTDGFGLYRRAADGTVRSDRLADGLAGDTVYALLEDAQGRVLVGGSGGLQEAHDGGYSAIELPTAGTPIVLALTQDADGALLVGTDRGVWREQAGGGYALLDHGLTGVGVLRILVDRAGNRWFGTVDRGLMRLSVHGLEVIDTSHGLPNNRVLSLFEDREGSLWAGSNGGLFRLRDAPFSSFLVDDGLPDAYVRSVLQHSDGTLWVGTSGGLARAEGERFVSVGAGTPLAGQSVLSLAEARDGGLWVGTYGDGLLHWRDGRVERHWRREDGLPAQEVRAVLEDPAGRLWVGTSHGLARIADGRVDTLAGAGGPSTEFVMALHQTADGTVYAGTSDGLRVAGDVGLTAVDLSALDGTRFVFGFHEDRARGELWLATDRGLVRYRLADGDARLLGRAAGLPYDKFFAVVADREEQFWLSSNRGVLRIDQSTARAVIAGTRDRIRADLYGESDGLASAQANGSSTPAATLAADGAIWIATARGAARVKPWRLGAFSARTPPALVEGLLADGVAPPPGDEPQLPAGTRRVEIDYAGLGFIVPERIRYRHRLLGLSEQWIEVEMVSPAVYTYLPPGDYVFEVAAAYPHGAWTEPPARLAFRIEAHPWQRPVFWVLAALLTLGLVLAGVQLRTRRLRQDSAHLQTEVQSRTQALRLQTETLTAISRERAALVEQLKQQAAAYERLALEDDLTGLPNRRAFDAALTEAGVAAAAGGPPLALAMIDIDHFKRINDLWSHTTGDRAIVAVARRMQAACRSGELLCRWGGEEFVLLLPGLRLDAARQRCEALRQALETLDVGHIGPGLSLTISIGLADAGRDVDVERLLVRADAALRRAKLAGRNRVVVDPA